MAKGGLGSNSKFILSCSYSGLYYNGTRYI